MSVASVVQYRPRLAVITFSKDGNASAGTYLRLGSVITSNTSVYLPYDGTIVAITASSQSTANSSIITLRNRTGVNTSVVISGGTLTIPTGQFRASGIYQIPVASGDEISCLLSSGATRSNLVVNVFIEF